MKQQEMDKFLIFSIHSFVDIITNSSSELYVVDENKIEEHLKPLLKILLDVEQLDYESYIVKYTDYKYKDCYKDDIPEGIDINNLYMINVSYHNDLLQKIVNLFDPIELDM